MKTSSQFPPLQRWNGRDLASAMTLQLSAMPAFLTTAGAPGDNDSRCDAPLKRELLGRYRAHIRPATLFRIHG